MRISQLLFLFLFFCLYANNFCNESLNVKSRDNFIKNDSNIYNKFRRKSHKKNFTKRKLEDGDADADSEDDFADLKIFIDYAEFEYYIPDKFLSIKDKFKIAMEKAKGILEDILKIEVISEGKVDIINEHDEVADKIVEISFGISKHSDIFNQDYLYFNEFNYYIFFKFEELSQESVSLILDETPPPSKIPYAGLILFNKKSEYLANLDISKFTQEYLNNLMLHHFIRLMGFDEFLTDDDNWVNYIKKESDEIYLDEEDDSKNKFTKTLSYARNYFGCPDINKINLYLNEENQDTYDVPDPTESPLQTNRLYWPKPIFSGEILTKFDYSEKPFLSGFTLAFLDDLPYLKVKKQYAGDLTRFGEYAGCSNNCDNFYSDAQNFWDCSVCREGYFKAIESSESETHCENNNNKDYYFLYNEESQIYKKCELEIPNCEKCSSKTKCTSCKKGYELEDKDGKTICEEDNGLSTGAIIGIVFGCVGFLAIVIIIIICILKRRNKEDKGELKDNDEEIPEKKDVDTVPQNVKDGQEDNVKVMDFSKNNEFIDADAEMKKDKA